MPDPYCEPLIPMGPLETLSGNMPLYRSADPRQLPAEREIPPGYGLWLVDAGLLEVVGCPVGRPGRLERAAARCRDLLRRQRLLLGLKRFFKHHGAIEVLTGCKRGDE